MPQHNDAVDLYSEIKEKAGACRLEGFDGFYRGFLQAALRFRLKSFVCRRKISLTFEWGYTTMVKRGSHRHDLYRIAIRKGSLSMKLITKSVALVLLFGLIASALSGCADNKGPESSQTANDPSPEISQPVKDPAPASSQPVKDPAPVISQPVDEPEEVRHQIGEYVACERTETEFGIIEIPQFCGLMPQSASTKEANEAFAQIRDMLLAEIEDYRSYGGAPEDGVNYSCSYLCSYRAAFCGDIVSVMLEYEDFYASGYQYISCNLDVENEASPVDAAAVIEACGVSEDTIKESIRYYGGKLMSQEWESQILWTFASQWAPIEGIGDPFVPLASELDDMVATSLDASLVYGDGEQLYIVAYYPSDAGASYYCKLIAVSDDPYDIDYLSRETPYGTQFKSAITDLGALGLVQRYTELYENKPDGLSFEVEFLMPIEIEYYSEPCYEIHAFYDEGDHISTAGRYAVSCYSGEIYEYDPVGDAYLLCPDQPDAIQCLPAAAAADAGALMSVYNMPDCYESWAQPKVREIDLIYEQTGDYYWFSPEAESMFVFVTEEGLLYGANVTVNADGSVSYGSEDRICPTQVKEGDAVLFHAVRPEGQPSQAIIFESAHHGRAVYLLHFDGMNGVEKLELVTAS